MKRHFEYYTQPEGATLKDRSRFWTWYMRGLHGDMDTRYEGDRRLARERAAALGPKTSTENGFNFRPLASNTYGYHPKGVSHLSKPAAAPETTVDLDNPRKDWSTPLKNLDDLMLMRDNEPPCDSARRRPLPSSAALRRQALDDELDGLLRRFRMWPRRGVANRLWRPHLFLDDDALLPPSVLINDPWWHKYPELRPLDLATSWSAGPPALRNSYLSPVKRTYLWRSAHPLRPYGYRTSD